MSQSYWQILSKKLRQLTNRWHYMELLHLDLVERDQVVGRNHQVVKDLVEEDLDEEVVEEDPVENVLAEKDLAEDEDEFLKKDLY